MDRPDAERRRHLRRQYKRAERVAWEAQLPFNLEELNALRDYVEAQVAADGCDRTLAATRTWLASRDHDVERVVASLVELGAGCDCEIVANIDPDGI